MNYDKTNTDILYCKTRVSPIAYIPADKAGTYRPDAQTSQYGIKLPFRVDSYTAEETWGKGGMSETYKGKDEQGNEVIIKIPKYDPDIEKRFLSECTILRKLDSPYIAKWLADGVQELQGQPRPYLVMSFVHGQTLRQRITSNQHTPWNDVSAMLENIAKALKHLHEQGYCHRDIKPENLIYDQDNGRWVLVDFGIAHENRPEHLLLTLLQNDGTWNYMSPEQQTNKASDIRSDIYALGTCAWEALIGTLPQRGTALPSKYELDDKLTVKDVTPEVDNLIEMMTEHHPEDRFQTPDDLLLALKTTSSLVKAKLTVQRKWKRWVKRCLIAGFTAAVLTGAWYVGDNFYERKLNDIASSEIRASIKLLQVKKLYRPLFWGESWFLSNIENLKKKAAEEKIEMEKNFQDLKEYCSSDDHSFADKITQCQNFINFWKGAAGSHKMIQDADELLAIYGDFPKLENINSQLDSAGDNYDEILKKFDNLNKITLKSEKANKRKDELTAKITDKTLGHISDLVQKNASETFEEACRILQLFIKINGNDDRVSNLQDAIFDNLSKEAEVSDQTKLLSLKDKLRHYEDCFGKTQKTIGLSKTIDTKLTSIEWAETHKAACESAELRNNFIEAKSLIVGFEKKYPKFSKGDIRQAKKEITEIYIKKIAEYGMEYNTCKNYVALFFEHFASDSNDEHKQVVRMIMFNAAVWRILRIYSPKEREKHTLEELRADITKDDWEYCTNEHKAFLREIQTLALENKFGELSYRIGRNPDVVHSDQLKNRFYKVRINKITVHLSPKYYSELKGSNNCDPRVKVYICDLNGEKIGDPIISKQGAINAQTFTIYPEVEIYLDTAEQTLAYEVVDDDTFGRADSYGALHHKSSKELYSLSNPNLIIDWSKWGDSTRMYVNYTVE